MHQAQDQRTVVHQPSRRPGASHGVWTKRNSRVAGRGEEPARPPPPRGPHADSKKNFVGILEHFEQLWQGCGGFQQQRVARRAQALALSSLLCPERRTVTGLLATSGAAFRDWSSA